MEGSPELCIFILLLNLYYRLKELSATYGNKCSLRASVLTLLNAGHFYYDQENLGFHLHKKLVIDEASISPSGQQSYTQTDNRNQRWSKLVKSFNGGRPEGTNTTGRATSVN